MKTTNSRIETTRPGGTRPSATPLDRMFGIDLRSLAAFRIAMGGAVLADLLLRLPYISAFYTDQGILPRFARILLFEEHDESRMRHAWSLHMVSGELWAQLIMFAIAILFAAWMMLGYRTRLATFATWLLLVSLDSRNPLLIDSGDVLLRSILFWSMFVPLGSRWSIDAASQPETIPLPRYVTSFATFALQFQVCAMYWFSIVFKHHPTWMSEFSALYYALNNDIFVTEIGLYLLAQSRILPVLTMATLGLELVGPILIFIPKWNPWLRMIAVIAFWGLHAGFGLCLAIGIFAIFCLVAWIPMLPGEFWDLMERWTQRCIRMPTSVRSYAVLLRAWFPHTESPRLRLSRLGWATVIATWFYLILWNVRETDMSYWEPLILPRQMNLIGRATGLDQNWSMFAPIPSTEGGWYVMEGTLRNGEKVNLWQPNHALPWEKPIPVYRTYLSQRWRKYLDSLKHDDKTLMREYFADWLTIRWNRHFAGVPDRHVASINITFQFEETPPPSLIMTQPNAPVSLSLWRWEYPDAGNDSDRSKIKDIESL